MLEFSKINRVRRLAQTYKYIPRALYENIFLSMQNSAFKRRKGRFNSYSEKIKNIF